MWSLFAGVFESILFGLCCGSFCSVLARSEFGRWTGLYKCTGQCTAVQSTVQSGLQHSTAAIADWDARRSGTVRSEAVYKAASLRLSANSEPSVSTKIAAVRRDSGTGRET